MVTENELIYPDSSSIVDKVIEVNWRYLTLQEYAVIDNVTLGRFDKVVLKYYHNMAFLYPLMIVNDLDDITCIPIGRIIRIYTRDSILQALSLIDTGTIPGVNSRMVSDNIKYNNDIALLMTKENKKRRVDATRSVGVNGITLKKVSVKNGKIIF
jgi:hypothetical protein